MSFVTGHVDAYKFDATGYGTAEALLSPHVFEHGDTIVCGVPKGSPDPTGYVTCIAQSRVPHTGYSSLTASTSDTVFAGSYTSFSEAPYWAIVVNVTGPGDYNIGALHCFFTEPDDTCVNDTAYYTELELSDTFIGYEGASISTSQTAAGSRLEFNRVEEPTANSGAYLANPSPSLPVPDALGNDFGEVLFTPDQIPASVTADFAVSSGGIWSVTTTALGSAKVTLTAFPYIVNPDYVPPVSVAPGTLMCVL